MALLCQYLIVRRRIARRSLNYELQKAIKTCNKFIISRLISGQIFSLGRIFNVLFV